LRERERERGRERERERERERCLIEGTKWKRFVEPM
jgi:RNA-binding protein 25